MLHLHLMGDDYRSIAKLLDKSPKSIDNALQRIKGKVAELIEETSKKCIDIIGIL